MPYLWDKFGRVQEKTLNKQKFTESKKSNDGNCNHKPRDNGVSVLNVSEGCGVNVKKYKGSSNGQLYTQYRVYLLNKACPC